MFFPFLTALAVFAGWREAALVLAGILAVVAIPALLILRESPAGVGARPLAPLRRPRSRRSVPIRA